jgi:hypothetical protein
MAYLYMGMFTKASDAKPVTTIATKLKISHFA